MEKINYKKLLNHIPSSMIIVDNCGKIQFINQRFRKSFDLNKSTLDTENLSELLPNYLLDFTENSIDTLSGSSINTEIKVGSKLFTGIELSFYPFEIIDTEDKLLLVIVRKTENRKQREQEFDQLKRAITEIGDYALILLDAEGNVTNWNRGAENIKGYSSTEIIGKNFRNFYTEKDRKALKPDRLLEEARVKGRASDEGYRVKKDGTTFYGSVLITAIHNDEGLVTGFSKVTRDLTQKKVAEEQANRLMQMELNQMQNRLIHAEKLINLGNLMAGIAHEINTPVSAIKSSVEATLSRKNDLNSTLQILKSAHESALPIIYQLIEQSVQNNKVLSTKEERRTKRMLRNNLQTRSIDNSDYIAEMLVDMNVHSEVELMDLEPIFREENCFKILKAISDYSLPFRNGATIKIATDKASKVIYALKVYARSDIEETFTETDVVENLETVLTLYANQLKHGVELVKEYESIDTIKALNDQLGQVWTNLIANAIHAMNGKGMLTIQIRNDEETIQVEINDTGKGIPEDIQKHIFEPFFTTKKGGEGSGLGLDLVKKIIEKHGGNISFKSEPGNTSFIVKLPKKEHLNRFVEKRVEELKFMSEA